MKSPLGKLRGFKLHKSDAKDKRDFLPSAQLDELAQAAEDMQDMRSCYDSLLTAAALAASSAFEFSESLGEMGSCLKEKTILQDEASRRILLMLGEVQFQLKKLVDSYRAHIIETITNPSESLLNELRTVEDMKRQCDEKRTVCEYMAAQLKEKGRSKSGKGESLTSQQLQVACNEYDDEATLCVFRLKSLKQGQSRSLLTQAARHHAAQLKLFRKGLKSLEAVEPHLRLVTEQQHIDYQLSGLEDYNREDEEDDGVNGEDDEGRELSFDYRQNKTAQDVVSASRASMEVDEEELSFPQASTMEHAELNPDKSQGGLQVSSRESRPGSFSAPIFPERNVDPLERMRMQQPVRESNTYVLPTPIDAKGTISSKTSSLASHTRSTDTGGRTHNLWHSSPLEQKKPEKDSGDGQLSEFTNLKARSAHKENNSNSTSTQLPLPLLEGLSLPQFVTHNASDNKKVKRQSFSGPITSKPSSTKPALSASGPISSTEPPQLVSGMLSRVPTPHSSSSPKVSPTASPPLISSPRISELHELPRPPGNLASKPAKFSWPVGHSAPLVRNLDLSGTNKIPSVTTNLASPLPTPPLIVPRSFSIPSSNQRAITVQVSQLLESPPVPDKAVEHDSPPLTPISLANMRAGSSVPEMISHSGQIRGGS